MAKIRITHLNDSMYILAGYMHKCFICGNTFEKDYYSVERFDFRIGEGNRNNKILQELACSQECAEMIVLQNI